MSTGRLERLLPVVQLVSTIAVPLIIAVGGWWVQATLAHNANAEQELQIALAVQSSPRHTGDERLRQWAARTISARFQKNAGIGVSPSDLTASAIAVPLYLKIPRVDPAAAQPAPPELAFSKCLREILRYGTKGQRISTECAALVASAGGKAPSRQDIGPLLDGLAGKADQVSAQLQLYQSLYSIVSQEQDAMRRSIGNGSAPDPAKRN